MQYVSIDIETTGLDPHKNQIVEVGAVLDHIGNTTPVEELPVFRAVLMHEWLITDAYCAGLHRDLWPEIETCRGLITDPLHWRAYDSGVKDYKGKKSVYIQPKHLQRALYWWLHAVMQLPHRAVAETPPPIKINVAGKNAGSFDIPFLEASPGWEGIVEFRRRVIDPAVLYVKPEDEKLPDLQECLKRAGIDRLVSHTAVDDARNVVRLIRKALP